MMNRDDRLVGPFRIVSDIKSGAGSQGTVHKAVSLERTFPDLAVGTVVALKVMPPGDLAQCRHLQELAGALAGVRHQNVVRYYGSFVHRGAFGESLVVVQEYLEGETLKEMLQRSPKGLDADVVLPVVDGALAGLAAAASVGVYHRDVKPGNVFVCRDGRVKMIDFESGRFAGSLSDATPEDGFCGSFNYMAPEFAEGGFSGDELSDVFSMGVVFHEALCGTLPYAVRAGEKPDLAFVARWKSSATGPVRISPAVRQALVGAENVLAAALAVARSDRCRSFSDFRRMTARVSYREIRGGRETYRILRYVGRGGFGEVFKARAVRSSRIVAVKHLLHGDCADRFRREARVMSKLSDASLVRLLDFFEAGANGAFMVMDYLEGMPGKSLRDQIRRGVSARDEMLRAFARYAHGLAVMHASGIYHRDIKPGNLYYPPGEPERAAIMDLGIARDVNGTATHGQVPGTLDYMPPEVASGSDRGSGGMDIYALGLCLVETLTGKSAYPRLKSGTEGYRQFFERARKLVPPDLDDPHLAGEPELRRLVAEMTQPDVRRRLSSAAEVERRIRALAGLPKAIPPAGGAASGPRTDSRSVGRKSGRTGVQTKDKRTLFPAILFSSLLAAGVAFAFVFRVQLLDIYQNFRSIEERRKQDESARLRAEEEERVRVLAAEQERIRESARIERKRNMMTVIRRKLEPEPVTSRRERIAEARAFFDTAVREKLFSDDETAIVRSDLEWAEKQRVCCVRNGLEEPIRVGTRTLDPGGALTLTIGDEADGEVLVTRHGFHPLGLPPDFDGKVVSYSASDFRPLPVKVVAPTMTATAVCQIAGRTLRSGESAEVLPGKYRCHFVRKGFRTQDMPVTLAIGTETTLPEPSYWMPLPAGSSAPSTVAAESIPDDSGTAVFRKQPRTRDEIRAEMLKSVFARVEDLLVDEPIEDRRERLEKAGRILTNAVAVDNLLSEVEAQPYFTRIGELKRRVVGIVENRCANDIVVGGRRVAAGKRALVAFETGLPEQWRAECVGFRPKELLRDFDGKTLTFTENSFLPLR